MARKHRKGSAEVAEQVEAPEVGADVEAVPVVKPRRWSPEAREKLRQRMRDFYEQHPEKRKELGDKISRHWTPEKRQEHAEKLRAVLSQPDVKERIRAGQKAFWDEFRAIRKEMGT